MADIDAAKIMGISVVVPFIFITWGGLSCIFEQPSLERYEPISILLFILAINILTKPFDKYLRNKNITKNNYEVFRKRWKAETVKQRKIRDWIIFLIVLNNVVFIPILIILICL